MELIERVRIDWKNTAKNLKLLRLTNTNLRRYVCFALNREKEFDGCGGKDCMTCKYEMDSSISQSELAQVFGVKESQIANWETGKSHPMLEYLIFYCRLCQIELNELIVFVR